MIFCFDFHESKYKHTHIPLIPLIFLQMDCRFKPMGCNFVTTNINHLLAHERVPEYHEEFMTFEKLFTFCGQYRILQNEIMTQLISNEVVDDDLRQENEERQLTEEKKEKKERNIQGSDEQEVVVDEFENYSICSTETSNDLLDYANKSTKSRKKMSSSPDDEDESVTTVSMPFRKHEHVSIHVLDTAVYADENHEDTFPIYLKASPTHYVNGHFCRLAYPTVVIENRASNSLIRVRFQVKGEDIKADELHFGVMNARGQYLRRLVNGSRHPLKDYIGGATHSSDMFSLIQLEQNVCDEGQIFDLTIQFRDFSSHNIFEGHYRDLRIVLMHINVKEMSIGAYDASSIFRVSPNQYYIVEKRLPLVIQELKWDQPVPPVPPMMGVKPTMRIQLDKQEAIPVFKKMKTLF